MTRLAWFQRTLTTSPTDEADAVQRDVYLDTLDPFAATSAVLAAIQRRLEAEETPEPRMDAATSARIRSNVVAYARGEYVWPTLAVNAALRCALADAEIGDAAAARLHRSLWEQGFEVVPRMEPLS